MAPAPRRPWSPAEEDDLRVRMARGEATADVALALGRSLYSVQNKLGQMRIGPIMTARAGGRDEAPAVAEWQARRAAAEAEVTRAQDVYEWLRPVELPAPPAPTKPRIAGTDRTLIAGDFHFPTQDDAACDVFLQAVAALRPRRVILNGDTVDLLAVSKYPKDARPGKAWTLQDEAAAFHAFLHRLHAIGDAWGLEVVETEANHSGNGTASRWWRYLSDRCPELLGHADAADLLSYQRWFYPAWSGIRLVDEVVVADDLLVRHGEMVRSQAGYSARGNAQKYHASVIVNHTHRMGYSPHRVPAIGGLRGEQLVRAYENGCMCRLEPGYGTALNWQTGFAIVTHHPAGEARYAVEQVVVHHGRAVVSALGGELAA